MKLQSLLLIILCCLAACTQSKRLPATVTPASKKENGLHYVPGKYQELLDTLYAVPQSAFHLLPKMFTADDAQAFIQEPITKKDVENANNIGFFLEQVNALPAAEVFLKKITEAFPEREVAWYNLGDVYLKMNKKREALTHYNTYIHLMNDKKQQDKIQQRIKDFVAANQNLL